MTSSLKLSLFATVAFGLAAPAFATSIVTNGSFATGDFTGWTLSGDSSGDYVAGSPGSFAAALTTGSAIGFLSQSLSLSAGQSYTLTFEVAGDGATPNSLIASVGGATLENLTDVPDTIPGYLTETAVFTATSSASLLSFQDRDDPGYLYVSGIAVTSNAATPAVTPEPSSLVLFGTGALGLIGAARRRFVKA